MTKYSVLAIVLLSIISIATGEGDVEDPCTQLTVECISQHFEPANTTSNDPLEAPASSADVTSDSTAESQLATSALAFNKDSGIAKNVVIEYPYFNTTLKRREMKISGLSKAQFYAFKIDFKNKKALLTVYFPKVTISGSSQAYHFHKTSEFDAVVDVVQYSTVLEEVYITAIYKTTNGFIQPKTGQIHTEIMKIPKFSTADALTAAGAKYPWVKEIIASTLTHPQVLVREYIKPVGEEIFNQYMESFKFYA